MARCEPAGILPDFAGFVFDDWASRGGKDGGGNIVPWLPYVAKRWAREGQEWRAGTHKGTKAASNGHGGAQAILHEKELVRVEKRIGEIRNGYEAHQTVSAADAEVLRKLKVRRKELKEALGFQA